MIQLGRLQSNILVAKDIFEGFFKLYVTVNPSIEILSKK